MARTNRRDANGHEPPRPRDRDRDRDQIVSVSPVAGDSVDDLRDRLVDLQATVEQLVERARVEPATGDPEIDRAARTLKFAQQTADAVVAEAREEAAAIVEDAERQRAEIIRRAHEQAEADYGEQRDHVLAATAAWQEQRSEVLAQLDGLATVISTYHGGVAAIDRTVTSVAGALRHDIAAMPLPLETEAGDGTNGSSGVPRGWRPDEGFWS